MVINAVSGRPPIFVLLISRRRHPRPIGPVAAEAWAYWKSHISPPTMTRADLQCRFDGSAMAGARSPSAGKSAVATANWFRDRLDEAHLAARRCRVAVLSGRRFNRAVIMANHSIARPGDSGRCRRCIGSGPPSLLCQRCVLVYAGGKIRYGVRADAGVHQFEAMTPMPIPSLPPSALRGSFELYDEDGVSLLSWKPCLRPRRSAGSAQRKPQR